MIITDLGSGWVKVTGDTSMMDEVTKHLTIVMAAKHVVQWPSHWVPQYGAVELFDVAKSSPEGVSVAAGMPGKTIVKVCNFLTSSQHALTQYHSDYGTLQ